MLQKYRWLVFIALLVLLVSLFLSGCGGDAPAPAEEPAAEEPLVEEAAQEEAMEEEAVEEEVMAEEEILVEATGSEEDGEESPFSPTPGAKVEVTRAAGWVDETTTFDETARAEGGAGGESDAIALAVASSEGEAVLAESAFVEEAPRTAGGGTGLDDVAIKAVEASAEALDGDVGQGNELTAGDVDDNAQWDDYLLYRLNYEGAPAIDVDVTARHQIFVRNGAGTPILGAVLRFKQSGEEVAMLRTQSDGRAYFFPSALPEEKQSGLYEVTAEFGGTVTTFELEAAGSQRLWEIDLVDSQSTTEETRLDLFFLIDTTGSMADEIEQLRENIRAIAGQIDALPSQPNVRYGMTVYRDRGDVYTTRTFEFTPDVEFFAEGLSEVVADGGGDYPEDLSEGLYKAVRVPEWRVEETISLLFVITDAPPQLIYEDQDFSYATEMAKAAERGIKIYPIGSSGLDEQGEYVLRQMAQYTGGRFLFLTYGAGGAGTTGEESNLAVADYDVTSLDGLVLKIIAEELAHQE